VSQAQAELQTLQKNIYRDHRDEPVFDSVNIRPLLESVVKDAKTPLYALLAASGCLLLIACLNVANLLVARAATRRKEVAIRAALGGSRWRLLSEQLTESLVLSFCGGSFGLAFAYWGIQWLTSIRQDMARADAIHIDGLVLLFAIGISLFCGFLAGFVPAFHATRSNVVNALQDFSRTSSGSQARTRLRKMLLAFEVGLTVVLLIGGGLLLKSYRELRSSNLGSATHNVLTMGLSLPTIKYKSPIQISGFYRELLEGLRQMPGVQAAGLATALPGQGLDRSDAFTIHEQPAPKGQFLGAAMRAADPGYFKAMQIPLLRGRTFNEGERVGHADVAIIDESFAKRYFSNEDPIGKHIDDPQGGPQRLYEIVGVVGNTLSRISQPPEPTMYFPLYSGEDEAASIAIRSQQDVTNLVLPVQKLIAQMDPDLPVSDVLTMEQIIGSSTLDTEFSAIVILAFGIASLILAAVGLFGVLSYLVTQRTNELGIRIALGAQRAQILRLVLVDGLRPAWIGLFLGLAAGPGAAQLIRSMLYGVHPLDFYVFTSVALLSIIVAVCASALPALRAARLDPVRAIRNE
jgi:predicted permease